MKFRNPETGEVFSGSILRRYNPFCHATICSKCPLQGPVTNCADTSDCSIWVVEHPHEAARLMGFEVVEDSTAMAIANGIKQMSDAVKESTKIIQDYLNKGKETNMDKPRICDVLGVDVGERFVYKDPNKEETTLYVEENGMVVFIFKDGQKLQDIGMDYVLVQAINHPDRIIRKPRFTQQEVESAKIISVLFPEATHIERLRGSKVLGITGAEDGWIADIESSLFPEIKSGQSVTLDEIIGGAE